MLRQGVLASGGFRGKQLFRDEQHAELSEPHRARCQAVLEHILSERPIGRHLPIRLLS